MAYEIDPSYNEVPDRIREFREKHPDGSLQQHDLQLITFADKQWVIYTAAAYRSPEDQRPGHGTAWEPVPGRTPYTRDSEVQNAETSAWGRAIVAVLAADAKKIASANEIRARQYDREQDQKPPRPVPPVPDLARAKAQVWDAVKGKRTDLDDEQRRELIRKEINVRKIDPSDAGALTKLAEQWMAS